MEYRQGDQLSGLFQDPELFMLQPGNSWAHGHIVHTGPVLIHMLVNVAFLKKALTHCQEKGSYSPQSKNSSPLGFCLSAMEKPR